MPKYYHNDWTPQFGAPILSPKHTKNAKKPRELQKAKAKNGGSRATWQYQQDRQALSSTPITRYNLADSRLDYEAYLASPYWARLRKEVLKRTNACEECGSRTSLNIHHRYYYQAGKSVLYRERSHPDLLVVLCYSCHMRRHRTAEV